MSDYETGFNDGLKAAAAVAQKRYRAAAKECDSWLLSVPSVPKEQKQLYRQLGLGHGIQANVAEQIARDICALKPESQS